MIISCSSLFALYTFPLESSQIPNLDKDQVWSKLEQLSTQMAGLSEHLLKAATDESDTFAQSPYVPYALYPTAAIQLRLWRRTGIAIYKERFDTMVEILRQFNKRWSIAG
jgi:hypothetical protein